MRKLALLVVILILGIAFSGCQQVGLTEEKVRSIVQEEVANQLDGAQLKGIIGQEVTKQLNAIDILTVSELHVRDKQDKSAIMIGTGSTPGIIILNSDGEHVAKLGTYEGSGQLFLYNSGETIAALGVSSASNGAGELQMGTSNGQPIVRITGGHGNGIAFLYNMYGNVVALVGASIDGDGVFRLYDKLDNTTFIAP